MAPDFRTYLATQVVAEKQTVSYRDVSRALKVHVNAAKCMLYEFHERENKKKPGSIYATYLICGTKKESDANKNRKTVSFREEDIIPSSPPPFTSSMLEPSQQNEREQNRTTAPTRTITLAREEVLEDTKDKYDTITSIHMYSISPGRLPDLIALTDSNRALFDTHFLKNDPLLTNKTYGVIQNPGVRRRKGKRPIVAEAPVKTDPKSQILKTESKATANGTKTNGNDAAAKGTVAQKEDSRPSSRDSVSTAQSNKPSLKRDSSNLFKAFAKQQEKPKFKRDDTDLSTNASMSGAEDVKMTDANAEEDEEGESEDEALFLDTNTKKSATTTKKRPNDIKKEREDKNAKLRKMMESDDEEVEVEGKGEEQADEEKKNKKDVDASSTKQTAGKNAEDVDWSDSDTEDPKTASQTQKSKEEETKQTSTAAPRRRRGKRPVVKKRTMKDEDGYLVTKEETVYESFSEDDDDDHDDKKKSTNFGSGSGGNRKDSFKTGASGGGGDGSKSNSGLKSVASTNTTTSATTSGKGGETKKKGNIMSFFGKK